MSNSLYPFRLTGGTKIGKQHLQKIGSPENSNDEYFKASHKTGSQKIKCSSHGSGLPKGSLQPAFVNKVLLAHGPAHSFAYHLGSLLYKAELSSCERPHPSELKISTIRPLLKKIGQP